MSENAGVYERAQMKDALRAELAEARAEIAGLTDALHEAEARESSALSSRDFHLDTAFQHQARVAELENAVTWHTDCLRCAATLQACHDAEARLAAVVKLCDDAERIAGGQWAASLSPAGVRATLTADPPDARPGEPLYDLDTKSWTGTCPCIQAMQRDPECPWHGRDDMGEREGEK